MTRLRATWLAAALACAAPSTILAQGSEPLRKTDVIRLLTSPLIGKDEVADLIRRNCLSFVPTERDWADFRGAGADEAIVRSIGGCVGRHRASAGTTLDPLQVAPLPGRVAVAPGTVAEARVLLTRGARVQAGVKLILRGSSEAGGGRVPDADAVTDDQGVALFRFPAGRAAGTYPLRVAPGDGSDLRGQTLVELVIRPGLPAQAQVQPSRLDLDSAGDVTISVALADSFGNAISNEPVELRADGAAMGVPTAARVTDSLGRAAFVLRPRSFQKAGTLSVNVRGKTVASIEAAYSESASQAGSGFLTDSPQLGTARTPLGAPLLFRVRGGSGRPLPGRVVVFRGYNADVDPVRVTTDTAGFARVAVTLGARAGGAVVTAAVDSVQQQMSLRVTPGAATEVLLEQNNVRVDGGHLFVSADTTFVLKVSARDAYGNPAPIGALARALDQMRARFNSGSRLLRMLKVDSDNWSTQVTFQPLGRGSAPLTLADATVTVEVIGRGASR